MNTQYNSSDQAEKKKRQRARDVVGDFSIRW